MNTRKDKLNPGDYVLVEGLDSEQREEIKRAFIEFGAEPSSIDGDCQTDKMDHIISMIHIFMEKGSSTRGRVYEINRIR